MYSDGIVLFIRYNFFRIPRGQFYGPRRFLTVTSRMDLRTSQYHFEFHACYFIKTSFWGRPEKRKMFLLNIFIFLCIRCHGNKTFQGFRINRTVCMRLYFNKILLNTILDLGVYVYVGKSTSTLFTRTFKVM